MIILFISVVSVNGVEILLNLLDVVYDIYRERIYINLDTVFNSEKTRVPKNNGMFSTYRVDWFPRSFFYNLPLYYNSFFYTQFTVHARYVDRNESFTGFQK